MNPARLPDTRLYAITDSQLSNCTHAEITARMLAGGAKLIQLRDKDASPKEILEAARQCLELTRAAGAVLIINDRVDVAVASGADGVHLGQDDMTVAEARARLGPDKIIGISTHNLQQVDAALVTSANYVAVGPVYSTSTKLNPDPVTGLELVKAARKLTSLPLVAIGGINLERAPAVLAAGADYVAVISALYPFPQLPSLSEDFAKAFTTKPDIEGEVRKFAALGRSV